jgi:hypothetical protein
MMPNRELLNENPMMGESYALTQEEQDTLFMLIDVCPLKAFQILNKRFNQKKFCILVNALPESARE